MMEVIERETILHVCHSVVPGDYVTATVSRARIAVEIVPVSGWRSLSSVEQ